MKNSLISIFLIIILGIFSCFITYQNQKSEVLEVYTPTKFGIDLNKDKIINTDKEIICADGIESFSLEPSEDFLDKYANKFNLSKIDIINMGYLAQEFSQKNILHKKVHLKLTNKISNECKYADIYSDNTNYKNLLAQSGFGVYNGEILNKDKYEKELSNSKKLNLVILNHHSNKYHTLDCEYGQKAHDKVILPIRYLPNDSKPCKFCHNFENKKHKIYKYKLNTDIINLPKLPPPEITITDGNITIYHTNFTQHLKPDSLCKTNECIALINLINNSKESIDIAIYGYDEIANVTTALTNAKKRGVNIRFIYDENITKNQNFYKSNDIIKNLSSVYQSDSENTIMHNKFVIFDDSIVFTGSMNFSKTGFSGYDQNDTAVIRSKEIARLYKKEFEQMLGGKFHKAKSKHNNSHIFNIGNSIVEIYFSPQDKSAKRIVQLINNSQKYIYMPIFLITHKDISNALILANKKGIDVKIIMDSNSTFTRNTKHEFLRKNNIALKCENYAGKLHSKSIIIDDKYVIMGSMNFSNSGENKNDENMLIINNPKFAKEFRQVFEYLWKMIPDKYLKYCPKAESPESIGSCFDGVDNNFNGLIDKQEAVCK